MIKMSTLYFNYDNNLYINLEMEILTIGKKGIISFHKELIHLYYQYIYRRPKLKQFLVGVGKYIA
jgi:hypothetical protein